MNCGCELLSFFVPLGWFTAVLDDVAGDRQLWIAFVLCTFGLIYSRAAEWVSLRWLWIAFVLCTFGLIYSLLVWRCPDTELWIAFVLCTFGLIYSGNAVVEAKGKVVNCFRSLYLWVDLQRVWRSIASNGSCELLSFFVPLGWFTAPIIRATEQTLLWIAFVLCTFGLIYSKEPPAVSLLKVVNCFRSLYLWVDLQPKNISWLVTTSCELLSFFVPLGWFTAELPSGGLFGVLWIAFVLCTFGLIYSITLFCFTSFLLWIAFVLCTFGLIYSSYRSYPNNWQLWIAFVLCTFGLIYSPWRYLCKFPLVVNCFRSLYLWVDLQPI